MLSEHDLKKLNALICALSRISYKIKKTIKTLRTNEAQYRRKLKEILENPPYNEVEVYSYADQITSIKNVLALFNRLAIMIDALRIRLITFRQFTLALRHINPDLNEAVKIANSISKEEEWIKRSMEEVVNWIGTLVTEIRGGVNEIENAITEIPVEGSEEVLRDLVQELRGLEEIGIKSSGQETLAPEEAKVGQSQGQAYEEVAVASSASSMTDDVRGDQREDKMDKLEKMVLSYIEKNGGKINLTRCACELGLSPKDVLEALRRLMEKNLIKLGG